MAYNLEPIEESDVSTPDRRIDVKDTSAQGVEEEHGASPMRDVESVPRVEGALEKSAAEKDGVYGQILAKVQNDDDDDTTKVAHVSQDASEVHQQTDRESQLQHLVDLAMTKSIEHAVGVAQHLGDYYMLDTFHDTLLHDDLHQKLVDHGMLKKE